MDDLVHLALAIGVMGNTFALWLWWLWWLWCR